LSDQIEPLTQPQSKNRTQEALITTAGLLGAVGLAALGELDLAKEWAGRALAIDPDDGLAKNNVACFYPLVGERGSRGW
jgi:hypothetical protein